jgi:hypothetical protein
MSTKNNRNLNLKILIPVVLLAIISIIVYILLRPEPIQSQEERIEKVKQDLVSLIPEKYEVVESAYEEPNEENDGCVYIYTIRPKEYSEIEREYLDDAGLMYCEDINTAVLRDQTEEVRYESTEGKWVYGDNVKVLEETQYGENLVPTVALGGSHALSNYYIVRLEDSDELVILVIPSSNRIRCERYDEEGVETMDEECVNFRDSLPPVYIDWVPEEIYDDYYKDLLEVLKNI